MERTSVKIISKDGELFTRDVSILNVSPVLAAKIATLDTENENLEPVPVDADAHIIRLILDWMEHNDEELQFGGGFNDDAPIPEWDEDWCERMTFDQRCAALTCAYNLELKSLEESLAKYFCNEITRKNGDELRAVLGIPTDEQDEAWDAQERAQQERPAGKAVN